jgi:hypothetical protein
LETPVHLGWLDALAVGPPAILFMEGFTRFGIGGVFETGRVGIPGFSLWLYAYTMMLWGFFGVVLVTKYGWRGLPVTAALGISCSIALNFLGVDGNGYSLLTLEPVIWPAALFVCWMLARPVRLMVLSWWTVGMLVIWVVAVHFPIWFGIPAGYTMSEPATMASWIVAGYKALKPI